MSVASNFVRAILLNCTPVFTQVPCLTAVSSVDVNSGFKESMWWVHIFGVFTVFPVLFIVLVYNTNYRICFFMLFCDLEWTQYIMRKMISWFMKDKKKGPQISSFPYWCSTNWATETHIPTQSQISLSLSLSLSLFLPKTPRMETFVFTILLRAPKLHGDFIWVFTPLLG